MLLVSNRLPRLTTLSHSRVPTRQNVYGLLVARAYEWTTSVVVRYSRVLLVSKRFTNLTPCLTFTLYLSQYVRSRRRSSVHVDAICESVVTFIKSFTILSLTFSPCHTKRSPTYECTTTTCFVDRFSRLFTRIKSFRQSYHHLVSRSLSISHDVYGHANVHRNGRSGRRSILSAPVINRLLPV